MTSGKWASSTRRSRLPRDWSARRLRVLNRDNFRCTEMTAYGRCEDVATDVDHVIPSDDHAENNLTSLCSAHHAAKSAAEGVAARRAKYGAKKRPPETHPSRLP